MIKLRHPSFSPTSSALPPFPQHPMPMVPAFRRSQPRGGGRGKKLVRNRGEDPGAVAEGRKVRPTSISHRHNLRPGASVELPSALAHAALPSPYGSRRRRPSPGSVARYSEPVGVPPWYRQGRLIPAASLCSAAPPKDA
ncbi:hypothetical protein IscW_ISCW017672 [Ixodes scapularis]|uniref:Uncharacterized protein n=1 Tax=Ixodes scapularis TaxID=6945 RepID=B7PEM9_IXOSC|nr:hypothetical protein IscW_ISCW017672 [Ixodes scapularis]|eukprot:XP_002433651.1 hypothetical protein IscW_ISCW017672 [Ixodes scapularis]